MAPIARMRRASAPVGLGTDAACCNNGMDLFEEMKVAGLLNKVVAGDPAALPTLDLLRAATSEVARARAQTSHAAAVPVSLLEASARNSPRRRDPTRCSAAPTRHRAKFPLDTFVERHWPRARGPGKFALSDPHAPGEASLERLVPKNHQSRGHRASWRLAGGSETRV